MLGNSTENHALSKLKPAFLALLEAFDYAEDTDSDRWDFAVGIRSFRELGLNDTDLRWLVRKGYVEHAREVTTKGENGRAFQATGDLTFCKRTCFVLTEAGLSQARSVTENQSKPTMGANPASEQNGHADQPLAPHWHAETHELRLNGQIVKRFKWQAVNQQTVLSAFQEEGWPARIDDPLPPHAEQDSKRRLADTIKSLNRKQQNQLIHFRGDGTGEGVTWDLFEPPSGERT